MQIQLNGEPMELDDGSTIYGLLEKLELTQGRLAVEVNSEIVPRSQHTSTELKAGDRVEIVQAIGGG
ncbi:MAG TPA: sulfur carrier protein ThiS [Pseudohongiella sp.]|nr:sulfur carrier protein ThiS [Pseudohongiella sp.]